MKAERVVPGTKVLINAAPRRDGRPRAVVHADARMQLRRKFRPASSPRSPPIRLVDRMTSERAGRDLVEKIPKPAIRMVSPQPSALAMAEYTALTATSVSALDSDILVTTQAAKSAKTDLNPGERRAVAAIVEAIKSTGKEGP